MTYAFIATKRNIYVIADSGDCFASKKEAVAFSPCEKSALPPLPVNPPAFRGRDVTEAYAHYNNYIELMAQKAENERLEKESRFEKIAANPDDYTPAEIWQAAVYLTKSAKSWVGADLLLNSKVFCAAILNKAKIFTVTPFDDGTLLVKVDGNRYGNKRGWSDITDLIS